MDCIPETLVSVGVSLGWIICITVLSASVVLRAHVHGVIETVMTLVQRLIQQLWWLLLLLLVLMEVVLILSLHGVLLLLLTIVVVS